MLAHHKRFLIGLVSLLGAGVIGPATASATVLPPWGSNLQAKATLDTATSLGHHGGADLAVWNTSLASGSPAAAQGGQVLKVNIKGCARQDPTAPTTEPDGTPVNEFHIQTLTPQTGGSYKVDQSSQAFTFPWCNQNGVTQDTISTFEPVHMCINQGEIVDFNDIGGYVLATGSYPAGVPYQIMASVSGSNMDSYTADNGTNIGATFSPGASGWNSEPNQELLLQAVEGVGDDAYGLCPGGAANEGSSSNTVICVYHHTNPGDPYATCDSNNQPVYAPVNTAPPSISGTAAVGQRLNEVHGTWTNTPGTYAYQWEDCDSSGASCSAISGTAATQGYYYPTASDVGHTIRVEEWAANTANKEGPAASKPTAVVAAGGGGSGGSGGGGSTATPSLTVLKLNPGIFYAAKGTTITFDLNRAGTVTFQVVVLKTHKVVKRFTHTSHSGGNAAKLRGLKAGRYQLVAVASAGGKTSAKVVKTFTVKPSRKHTVRHTLRLAADIAPF